jgi:hypothetical protein
MTSVTSECKSARPQSFLRCFFWGESRFGERREFGLEKKERSNLFLPSHTRCAADTRRTHMTPMQNDGIDHAHKNKCIEEASTAGIKGAALGLAISAPLVAAGRVGTFHYSTTVFLWYFYLPGIPVTNLTHPLAATLVGPRNSRYGPRNQSSDTPGSERNPSCRALPLADL